MKRLNRYGRKISYSARYIVCSKCKQSGGTMVKIGDHYEHQDKEKCRIMQLRKTSERRDNNGKIAG